MTLIRLKDAFENRALPEQIRQTRHMQGVEKVNFEVKFVSNMETVEWDAFDERDVRDVERFVVVDIAPVADS